VAKFDEEYVLSQYRELKTASDSLRGENVKLKEEIENLKKGPAIIHPHIKFVPVSQAFALKYQMLKAGIIDLDMVEISLIWSSMFEKQNIIYCRATSRISPSGWKNPWMVSYDSQQRANAVSIVGLLDKEKALYEVQTEKAFNDYQMQWFGMPYFERTFIVTESQLGDPEMLADVIEIMCDQSHSNVAVRVCYDGDLLAADRRDFGIAVSKEGEIWLYELVTKGSIIYGGKLICNGDELVRAVAAYKNIHLASQPINSYSKFEAVAGVVIDRCRNAPKLPDIDVLNGIEKRRLDKVAHKCLACFIDSETKIRTDDWQKLPEAKRVWYEMIAAENNAVLEWVKKHKPRRVLEVGCGPGRFIELLVNLGLANFDEILGIDCDGAMCNYANKRFDNKKPKVRILKTEVKDFLPVPIDNHYDFCINGMNIVGWQENASIWLDEMLRCSKSLFFTVFKAGNEDLRMQMYKERKHELSDHGTHKNSDGQIVLGDSAVMPFVKSRSYTSKQMEELCQTIASTHNAAVSVDDKSSKLLYLCFVYKRDYIKNGT